MPSIAWWPNLKALPNFSTVYLETSRQPSEENMDFQLGLIWFLTDQFLMNVDDSSCLVSAVVSSSGGDQKLGVSMLTKWNKRILPLIHNFKGLNGYRARVGRVVVVGLSIVRPTTKQWGKVEVGLGFGNYPFTRWGFEIFSKNKRGNWNLKSVKPLTSYAGLRMSLIRAYIK